MKFLVAMVPLSKKERNLGNKKILMDGESVYTV